MWMSRAALRSLSSTVRARLCQERFQLLLLLARCAGQSEAALGEALTQAAPLMDDAFVYMLACLPIEQQRRAEAGGVARKEAELRFLASAMPTIAQAVLHYAPGEETPDGETGRRMPARDAVAVTLLQRCMAYFTPAANRDVYVRLNVQMYETICRLVADSNADREERSNNDNGLETSQVMRTMALQSWRRVLDIADVVVEMELVIAAKVGRAAAMQWRCGSDRNARVLELHAAVVEAVDGLRLATQGTPTYLRLAQLLGSAYAELLERGAGEPEERRRWYSEAVNTLRSCLGDVRAALAALSPASSSSTALRSVVDAVQVHVLLAALHERMADPRAERHRRAASLLTSVSPTSASDVLSVLDAYLATVDETMQSF